jgi:CheY-specific phosphatase CheX
MSTLTERAHSFAEIQDYLVKSTSDLFGAYGMRVEYSTGGAAEVHGSAVMAIIGYAAESVRGMLLILTSHAVVDALTPKEVHGSGAMADVSRDVLGEFSNMLLGRVKNQLVLRDVAPLLTTPTTVFGDDLQLPAPISGMSAWHTFTGAAGSLFVRFDATFEAGFALAPAVDGQSPSPVEGEVMMF